MRNFTIIVVCWVAFLSFFASEAKAQVKQQNNGPGQVLKAWAEWLGGDKEAANKNAEANLRTANAAVMKADGEREESMSRARKGNEEARGLAYDNKLKWTQTFYGRRELRDGYKMSKLQPQPTQEDRARYSASSTPKRLTATQLDASGRIHWPTIFQGEKFLAGRIQLDAIFASPNKGSENPIEIDSGKVKELTDQMLVELKTLINDPDVTTTQYTHARKFLCSLAYEPQLRLKEREQVQG